MKFDAILRGFLLMERCECSSVTEALHLAHAKLGPGGKLAGNVVVIRSDLNGPARSEAVEMSK